MYFWKKHRKAMEQLNIFGKKSCQKLFEKVRFFLIFIVCTAVISIVYDPILTIQAQPTAGIQDDIISYTVTSGDTLWNIAQKHGTGISEITAINNLKSNIIYVGQVLRIPQGKHISYRINRGDTLGLIAENFGTSIGRIKNLNGLTSDMIYTDQLLLIPANYTDYTVTSGDSLWGISQRFGTTIHRIILFNHLTSSSLRIGQVLRIPSIPQVSRVTYIHHIVQSGENPWNISIKYGIPHPELLKVNNLTQASVLRLGQRLTIPVYSIPVQITPGPSFGEHLDWWTEAQYIFPIGKIATVTDFTTGRSFSVRRTIGANHADCEPLTTEDTDIIRSLWGGNFSWVTRAVLINIEGRKIAGSMSSMPHGIQYIENNQFNGHFDIHFKNSTRHKDGAIDPAHQAKLKVSAGIN